MAPPNNQPPRFENRGQAFQSGFQDWMNNRSGGFSGVYAGFGDFRKPRDHQNKNKNPADPTTNPVTQPNPLDQPPNDLIGGPAGQSNPWLAVPPMQPWMNNPNGMNPWSTQWGMPNGYTPPSWGSQSPYNPGMDTSSWGPRGMGGPEPGGTPQDQNNQYWSGPYMTNQWGYSWR